MTGGSNVESLCAGDSFGERSVMYGGVCSVTVVVTEECMRVGIARHGSPQTPVSKVLISSDAAHCIDMSTQLTSGSEVHDIDD